ncbi:MAG TPA: sigma-70 family RNA polymerase sigma factor [Blastocatellia bacterium]|nr:sigma-70 family RNA polymerase sigma factor [Blastocatellia bacterium]
MKDANPSNQTPFDPVDEVTLIERLRAHDQTALDAVYQRYSSVVYAIALRIVGQPADAEDVVVDSFWQVWQQADSYDATRGQLRTWIVTIARSRALDRLRGLRRSPLMGAEEVDVAGRDVVADDDPEQAAWLAQKASIVRTAMAALPREQRQALELAYYIGLSQSEIAERLGEPLGTIKTRIRLGMMKLREQLQLLQGS